MKRTYDKDKFFIFIITISFFWQCWNFLVLNFVYEQTSWLFSMTARYWLDGWFGELTAFDCSLTCPYFFAYFFVWWLFYWELSLFRSLMHFVPINLKYYMDYYNETPLYYKICGFRVYKSFIPEFLCMCPHYNGTSTFLGIYFLCYTLKNFALCCTKKKY